MKAVILSAGRGTRLGEICEHTPKPLVELGGEPVLVHNLRWLAACGITDIAINLHHLGEQIESLVGDGSRFGVSVRYSKEPELLGTAGAVAALGDWLEDGPFLVAYGDNRYEFDLGKLICDHETNLGVATLAVFSLVTHSHSGIAGGKIELDSSQRILRFIEGRPAPTLDLVNAGCFVLDPLVLSCIPAVRPADFGKDVFAVLLREHKILCGHLIDGSCLGIDTPEALAAAQALLRKEEGVTG